LISRGSIFGVVGSVVREYGIFDVKWLLIIAMSEDVVVGFAMEGLRGGWHCEFMLGRFDVIVVPMMRRGNGGIHVWLNHLCCWRRAVHFRILADGIFSGSSFIVCAEKT
jgi:hypothetical protein